jgi:uncharacterized protein
LEGVWHLPEDAGRHPAVVVCHPHPLYGGDMNNSVVYHVCQALAERSIAALRFNFRGAGGSGGRYGEGAAEQDDVKAALEFVAASPYVNPARLGLAGYSFGAGVAAAVAVADGRVRRLALVSPYVADDVWEKLRTYPEPLFIISGEDDNVIPAERLGALTAGMSSDRKIVIVPGTDHFWDGRVARVAANVADFFAAGLSPTGKLDI